MRKNESWCMVLLVAVLMGTTAPVQAQDVATGVERGTDQTAIEPAPERVAMEWGHKGLRLFSERKWLEAAAAFERAESLAHSPVFLLYAARARERDLKRVAALLLYRQCESERLPEGAPVPWVAAVRDARREGAQLAASLSTVRLSFSGSWTRPLRLRLPTGDTEVEAESLEVSAEPGRYELLVRDARGQEAFFLWLARAGEHQVRIDIPFPSLRPEAPSPPEPLAGDWQSPNSQSFLSKNRKGAIVAFGLGATSLLGALVAGGVALSQSQLAKQGCVDSRCPEENEAYKFQALTSARLATAGFVVAGVGGVLGFGLWLIPPKQRQTSLHATMNLQGAQLGGNF